jgi:hypothetical protein
MAFFLARPIERVGADAVLQAVEGPAPFAERVDVKAVARRNTAIAIASL